MDSIAARALAARKFAKMTQKQAEAVSGVKQSNISKIERGETERPQGLLALARAYRADPNWLDTGDGPAPWEEAQLRRSPDITGENFGSYRVTRIPPPIPGFRPGTPGTVPLISWAQAAVWTGPAAAAMSPAPPAPSARDIRRGRLPAAPPPGEIEAERWIPCIARFSPLTYAVRVRGDSMTAPNGQLKSYPTESIIFVDAQRVQPVDGERVVARLDATGETTFKVFKEEDGRRWLQPINPAHEPIRLPFTVLGTVIGKWEDED